MKTCHTQDEIAYITALIHLLNAEGACAEIGVYQGFMAKLIGNLLPTKEVHLFDTFEGILSGQDEENWPVGNYRCDLKTVKKNLGDDFIYHVGDICKTKKQAEGLKLAFVHVDIDVYKPLKTLLPVFWKQLSTGGIMAVSNVDHEHPGVLRATKEFKQIPHCKYSRYNIYKK